MSMTDLTNNLKSTVLERVAACSVDDGPDDLLHAMQKAFIVTLLMLEDLTESDHVALTQGGHTDIKDPLVEAMEGTSIMFGQGMSFMLNWLHAARDLGGLDLSAIENETVTLKKLLDFVDRQIAADNAILRH